MFIYKLKPIGVFNTEIYKTDEWIPSNDIGFIGNYLYHDKKKEICYVLPYQNEKLLGVCEISTGNERSTDINFVNFDRIKEHFNPTSLLVIHNHPDNRALFPSLQDREMNRSCIMYCNQILRIPLRDNLIFVPNGEYISFMNEEEWEYAR